MPIPIKKPVTRLTAAAFPYRGGDQRPLAVTLAPGDLLRFRFKGTRTSFDYPIASAFGNALRAHAAAAAEARKAARRRSAS